MSRSRVGAMLLLGAVASGLAAPGKAGPADSSAALSAEGRHPAASPLPEGFVDLASSAPATRLDTRNHTADTFSGAPLPGYGLPGAWTASEAAERLLEVQRDLGPRGLGLLFYDAYRPRP